MIAADVESFFDTQNSLERLWSEDVSDIHFSPEEIRASGEFYKHSQQPEKFKKRYFVLTKEKLIYFKNPKENRPLGFIELMWCKTLKINKEEHKPLQFGIRFTKNKKYSDLWTDSESQQLEWMIKLSKLTIQSEFHHKYAANKMIGKGSFARVNSSHQVYLVTNNVTLERFAVKAFSKESLEAQAKGRESLMNEIRVMKELSHPNIMRLEEVHESANSIYLVTELLEGGELLNQIKADTSFSIKQLAKVMKDILKALAYMDSKGIMHRDLKPENIILKNKNTKLEANELKLVDFGLATFCNVSEYLFKRCGTPGFVAPEVINAPKTSNIRYNSKCDVYSAGIILHLLITGKGPFEGKSFSTILAKNKEAVVNYDNPYLCRVSSDCLNMLKKMLRPDPAERLSAAECLAQPFLDDSEDEDLHLVSQEEGIGDRLKDFQKKYQSEFKSLVKKKQINPETEPYSMVIRAGGSINGRTDSFKDSIDFDPTNSNQGSLAYVNNAKISPGIKHVKRESIYKAALLSQLKNSNLEELTRMSQTSVDSQSEGTNSDEDEIADDAPKKSRFGPKA